MISCALPWRFGREASLFRFHRGSWEGSAKRKNASVSNPPLPGWCVHACAHAAQKKQAHGKWTANIISASSNSNIRIIWSNVSNVSKTICLFFDFNNLCHWQYFPKSNSFPKLKHLIRPHAIPFCQAHQYGCPHAIPFCGVRQYKCTDEFSFCRLNKSKCTNALPFFGLRKSKCRHAIPFWRLRQNKCIDATYSCRFRVAMFFGALREMDMKISIRHNISLSSR